MPKISDLPAAASAGATDEYPANQAGTTRKITNAQLWAYIKATIEALSGLTPDAADSFLMLENDNTMSASTMEAVEDAISDRMWAEADIGAAIADADIFMIMDGGAGGTKAVCTASRLATYMLAEIAADVLDISGYGANATPADTDIILTETGTTPKQTTWAQLRTSVLGGLDTYLSALGAAGAGGDTDLIYVTQAGVEKKMTLLQLKTYVGVSITGTGVANQFARWTNATNLKADIGLTASGAGFAAGSDVSVPTTAAVRGEMDTIISDDDDIGADLADADTILVHDATAGAQKKSALSRLYTWLLGQVTPGTVSASEIVVPDANKDIGDFRNLDAVNIDAGVSGTAGTVDVFPSTAARGKNEYYATNNDGDTINYFTNEAMAGARTFTTIEPGRYAADYKMNTLHDRYRLEWVAGAGGYLGLAANITPASADDGNDGATKIELELAIGLDPQIMLDGTNVAHANCSYYVEGGYSLVTAGANGDQAIIAPRSATDTGAYKVSPWASITWGTDQKVTYECRIRTAANISDIILFAGLKSSTTIDYGTDNNQAYFRYEDGTNGGKWECVESYGGTDNQEDSGVTVAVDTDYHLVVEYKSDDAPKFYINGALVYESENSQTADLTPYAGVETDAAAAKTLHVRGQAIERDFA